MSVRQGILVALVLGISSPGFAAQRTLPPSVVQATQGLQDCPGGGFALPGSRACIRLGGSVTATTVLSSGGSKATGTAGHVFSQHVVGRISADVRVPTELGPFRAYTSLRVPMGEDRGFGR